MMFPRLLLPALALVLALAAAEPPSAPPPDLEPTARPAEYATCPQTVLQNGALTLRVMHPDPVRGFYRGWNRFEPSGIIAEASSDKHTYIGRPPAPGSDIPQLSLGTTSEFKPGLDLPAPSLDAPARLLRIGVGTFQLVPGPDGKPAPRLESFIPWTTKAEGRSITYEQSFQDPSGCGYAFRKVLTLDDRLPEVRITYSLKNTGTLLVSVEHYNHNWFCLDGDGVGPAYKLQVPYQLEPLVQINNKQNNALLVGNVLEFGPPSGPYQTPFYLALGPIAGVQNNRFTLRNVRTGAFVEHQGDWEPSQLKVYATDQAFCPEPHLKLDLAPGGERTWSSLYRFRAEAVDAE